ncbi:hypothetical protein [Turicibacter bilis]|uniref:hypothetical protein n=1 Tax=Turicibacter bilis TaxID=2735723 RepID=UPI003F8A52B4
MKKKYWLGGVLSAMVIVGGVAMVRPSLALFTSQDSEINEFETGNVDIEIIENFNGCELTESPKTCTKEVSIQNITSKTDAIIRVAIIPYWQDESENAWPGDVSGVDLHFGEPTEANKNPNLVDINSTDVGWVDGRDGYYYYNQLVPAHTVTEQLLSSVTVTIPDNLQDRYDGKTLIVDVKAEAVQPTLDAVKAVWPNLSNDVKVMIEKMDGIK